MINYVPWVPTESLLEYPVLLARIQVFQYFRVRFDLELRVLCGYHVKEPGEEPLLQEPVHPVVPTVSEVHYIDIKR